MSGIQETDGLKSALPVVLVIAHSGRMLAQAVRHAGYIPLVIDLFADQDAEALAEKVWQVGDLSLATIRQVIRRILLSYKIHCVIYGSGMENQPETLIYLAENFTVAGNTAAVCKRLSCKKTFFKQLDTLGIRHPEVRFCLPEEMAAWLIKPSNHLGGVDISWCDRKTREGEYYQKFCLGQSGSVLFCTDGQHVDLIGFHRQWTVDQENFSFAGIIQECVLPEVEQQRVQSWLEKLINSYNLKGLGSLDFIWNGESCYFLEINPRPPASMMLYPELDLIDAHMTGQLTLAKQDKKVRALQVVYAQQSCKIQKPIEWPEWSFDRPNLHTRIQKDEPICTIMAQEKTVQQTLDSLLEKKIIIENNLY